MRDDRDTARAVDPVDRLGEREAGRYGRLDAEPEDVAGGARHLHPADADEPVVGGELGGARARVVLVVVGDGERVEADRGGPLQQRLDGVAAVEGERRVGVELDR